jgi:hypothetical protein
LSLWSPSSEVPDLTWAVRQISHRSSCSDDTVISDICHQRLFIKWEAQICRPLCHAVGVALDTVQKRFGLGKNSMETGMSSPRLN